MDLPVRFRSETEVILEESQGSGRFWRGIKSKPSRVSWTTVNAVEQVAEGGMGKRIADEQEGLAQRNIREFIARHGTVRHLTRRS